MKSVGIIGTGEIGWRMGKLLKAAGYGVAGYDISTVAQERARASGFNVAEDIADLCRQSDIVLTCVTDGAALREVVLGRNGVTQFLDKNRPLVDTTSAEPWITHELAVALADRGIPFLDAPVSGGVPAADAGKMNFMVGGPIELLDRCRPVFGRLGPVITHVGKSGAGHTVKAINMLALAASMLATAEILAVGLSCGLELKDLVKELDASEGASYSTRIHYPRFVVPGNYASGFTFDLMLKDLAIGIGVAERSDVPLYLTRTTYEFYRGASRTGLRGKDNTRVVEALMASGSSPKSRADQAMIAELLVPALHLANLVIASEVVAAGRAAGLRSGAVIEVLSASSGDSHALTNCLPECLSGTDRKASQRLEMPLEALSRCTAMALGAHIPVPLISQAAAISTAAIRGEGDSATLSSVVDLVSRLMGQPTGLDFKPASGAAA